MKPINHSGRRIGFSLIDLLVVIGITIVVLSILLMRVSGSRESARRMECESKLRNVFLAMESYALLSGHYPIGTQNDSSPIRSETVGYHQNWVSGLLPMLGHQELCDKVDFDFGVYDSQNQFAAVESISELVCPATSQTLADNATSYAAVTSSIEHPIDSTGDGMFVQGRPIRKSDLGDGTGYVLMVGEKARDFGMPTQWNSGTRASLRNAGHRINQTVDPGLASDPLFVGGFSSNHSGGAYFLIADGSFRFLADQMDLELFQKLAGRSDITSGEDSPE